jgi:hypothetical protein
MTRKELIGFAVAGLIVAVLGVCAQLRNTAPPAVIINNYNVTTQQPNLATDRNR